MPSQDDTITFEADLHAALALLGSLRERSADVVGMMKAEAGEIAREIGFARNSLLKAVPWAVAAAYRRRQNGGTQDATTDDHDGYPRQGGTRSAEGAG